MNEGLMLKPVEQTRLATLNLILEKELSVKEASLILKLSERHIWRLLSSYRKEGVRAVAHGNRGLTAYNATSKELRDRIVRLARTSYRGLNHTHLTEMLIEKEGISLSRSTVRNILIDANMPSHRRRRPSKYRCRRPRMPHVGMLIQIDGSYHDWLEGRAPYMNLLLAVDDATGTVPFALFRGLEDTDGYFLLLDGIIRRRGIPMALYTDRHGVFKQPGEDRRNGQSTGTTQFARAMKELGISLITARSPEAKGRIERMASTFQDRLVSELRLAGIANLTDANRFLVDFLPRFNARFGLVSAEVKHVYRQPSPDMDLASILCCRYSHMVARDNTIRHKRRLLQLEPSRGQQSYVGYRVVLRRYPNGVMEIYSGDQAISFREIPQKPRYFSTWTDDMGAEGAEMPAWLESIFMGKPDRNRQLFTNNKGSRRPTPRQQALWEAVQAAKHEGLPILRIAKALRITRGTVRKYMAAPTPPLYRARIQKQKEPDLTLLTKSLDN
jgi:transposase